MFVYINSAGTVKTLTHYECRKINCGDYQVWEHKAKGEKPLQVIFKKEQKVDLYFNGVSQSDVADNIFNINPDDKSNWLICHTNRSIVIESCSKTLSEDVRNAVKHWHPGVYIQDFLFHKVLPDKVYVLAIKNNSEETTKTLNDWKYYVYEDKYQAFDEIHFDDLKKWEKIVNG